MAVFLCPACGKTLHGSDRWPSEHVFCTACGMISEPPIDPAQGPPPGAAWSAASQWSASSTPSRIDLSEPSENRSAVAPDHETSVAESWGLRVKWMSIGAAAIGLPLLMLFAVIFSQNRLEPRTTAAVAIGTGVLTTRSTTTQSSVDAAIVVSRSGIPLPSDSPSSRPASTSKPIAEKGVDPPLPTPSTIVEVATKPAPPVETAAAGRPPLQPTPIPRDGGIGDDEVERSIQRGVDYLTAQFDPKRHVLRGATQDGTARGCGANALSVYALLQAGLALNDERLSPRGELGKGMLDGMKSLPNVGGPETFATSMRAACLGLFNRSEDRAALAEDAESLIRAQIDGAYSTSVAHRIGTQGWKLQNAGKWDNSNSQFGAMGVWAAADAGIAVPPEFWDAIETHWNGSQCENGQWSIGGPAGAGSLSMTAAGLATLFSLRDFNDDGLVEAPIGRPPYRPAIQDALEWWTQGDNAVNVPETEDWGYSLFEIERVGLESGLKYFGKHDWFRTLAKRTISRQLPDGSWDKNPIETSYVLLFLSRGRHPVLINKLRFDGYWANRPRSAANFTRFASRELERPINWQVVDLTSPWQEWLDAPILSIASHKAPKFTDDDVDKLRNYALAGGMIFTQSDGQSKEFDSYVVDLGRRLFPQYALADLPDDHPLRRAAGKGAKKSSLPLRAIRNGARILLLHSPTDIAERWQLHKGDASDESFQFGLNLLAYVGGPLDLRKRLDSPYIGGPPAKAPLGRTKVARAQYAGDWDPEPGSWQRFGRLFQFRTGIGLDLTTVKLSDLATTDAPLAHLAGSAEIHLSDQELTAIKSFVERGGVLFIDDLGAGGAFTRTVRESILKTLSPAALKSVNEGHPLLRGGAPGMTDIARPIVRPYAVDQGIKAEPPKMLSLGTGHVIFSSLDVSSGFLGTGTWGIVGYEPRYAQFLMQNVIFWTMDGQPDGSAAATRGASTQTSRE